MEQGNRTEAEASEFMQQFEAQRRESLRAEFPKKVFGLIIETLEENDEWFKELDDEFIKLRKVQVGPIIDYGRNG